MLNDKYNTPSGRASDGFLNKNQAHMHNKQLSSRPGTHTPRLNSMETLVRDASKCCKVSNIAYRFLRFYKQHIEISHVPCKRCRGTLERKKNSHTPNRYSIANTWVPYTNDNIYIYMYTYVSCLRMYHMLCVYDVDDVNNSQMPSPPSGYLVLFNGHTRWIIS